MTHPLDNIECTHPDHDHTGNVVCMDRAIGCDRYCFCCLGQRAEVNYWRDRGEKLEDIIEKLYEVSDEAIDHVGSCNTNSREREAHNMVDKVYERLYELYEQEKKV